MKLKIIFVVMFAAAAVYPQEVLDKIVAVVGSEIITKSELDFQTNYMAAQRRIDPNTPGLRSKVLNELVNEKLIYTQANLDSIVVTDDEVTERVDYQIQFFERQYGSKQKVEEVYGMSIEKIKRELSENIRKQLMIQKLQQKNFAMVEATRRDVVEFFDKFKDSLGVIPEKVTISHIFISPKTTEVIKQKYRELAESILDSLKNGAEFSEMAKKYSKDPGSADNGGDLGFVKKGVFYPEFEAAAFALEPGEVSGIVETPVGFHIIKLIEKRGASIHAKHILIKIESGEDADLTAIRFLNAIRDSVVSGAKTFSELAKKYSEDEETSAFGGSLGTFYLDQLDKNLLDIVTDLDEGEISFPKRIDYGSSYGYHIVYLEERVPQHQVDLQKDYVQLKKLASEYKRQKQYNEWIESLRDEIYYEIRM